MMSQFRVLHRFLLIVVVIHAFFTSCVVAGESSGKPVLPQVHSRQTMPRTGLERSEEEGSFGVISDIHFDPFYDPSLVEKLIAAEPSAWGEIFASSSIAAVSTAGHDTNYPLLNRSLQSLSGYAAQLDYLLVPGDLLAHHFRNKYALYAPDKSDVAYQHFVLKTTQYITGELRTHFPDIPVIIALGNNDSYCGDYRIAPAAGYLYDTKASMTPLAGSNGEYDTYPELGAYVLPHPRVNDHYFVVFDNLFFSRKYQNSCGQGESDPAEALLLWLQSTFYRLQRSGATATLVMHVPSGIDAYRSTNVCGGDGEPVSYLDARMESAFTKLVMQYHSRVTAMFSGHTHMDDYRVFTDENGSAFAYQLIVPSISPIFGNNPGYQIYRYNRETGSPVNFLTMTYADPHNTGTSSWSVEYNFMHDYGVGPISPDSLMTLSKTMRTDTMVRKQFIEHYTGGADAGTITNATWPAFACAIMHTEAEGYSNCLCHKEE